MDFFFFYIFKIINESKIFLPSEMCLKIKYRGTYISFDMYLVSALSKFSFLYTLVE